MAVTAWGGQNFKRPYYDHDKGVSICDIVEQFPVKLKQAMFSASTHGTLRRKTWNNCAFNGAGKEVKSINIASYGAASEVFGVSYAIVKQFIRLWDKMPGTDDHCNQYLRTCIEKAGLFMEPGTKPPRIIKVKVFENQEKVLREQFDALMEANMVPNVDNLDSLFAEAMLVEV